MWTRQEIWTLMCYSCQKYIMFEPKKKYRGVMCHNTEEWCKIWGGTLDLHFQKWHEEFCEFWPNTRMSQNLSFNGLLLINVWAEKLQVMCHDTEGWCNI